MPYTFSEIGKIRSPFKEKFGIPRHSGLAPSARGAIVLPCSGPRTSQIENSVRSLETYSHIWVIFVFHDSEPVPTSGLVRPPRLGGKTKVGVFASRTPHRINPIGLSCLKLERINRTNKTIELEVSGLDLLDGTPVLDIKPYIPEADSLPRATQGWTRKANSVKWKTKFNRGLSAPSELKKLIREVLAHDPRPSFQARSPRKTQSYGMSVSGFNFRWKVESDFVFCVTEITQTKGSK